MLQILTQIEVAIKRDYLSADFETTEELLHYCASSIGAYYEFAHPGSIPQLPWIPKTTASVAMKLLELDASISYVKQKKAVPHDVEKVEPLPVKCLLARMFFARFYYDVPILFNFSINGSMIVLKFT